MWFNKPLHTKAETAVNTTRDVAETLQAGVNAGLFDLDTAMDGYLTVEDAMDKSLDQLKRSDRDGSWAARVLRKG